MSYEQRFIHRPSKHHLGYLGDFLCGSDHDPENAALYPLTCCSERLIDCMSVFMNTKTQEQEKTQDHHEEQGHVHGPNCNHGHNHAHIAPVIRTGPKVGRNDECPCGSKQKFKKCCGK